MSAYPNFSSSDTASDWLSAGILSRLGSPFFRAANQYHFILVHLLCTVTLPNESAVSFALFDGAIIANTHSKWWTNCKQTMNKLWTIEKRVSARLYIIYITRRACPALAIKNFNRFPLYYYYIESIRFCQVFTESFTFPNMTDCTNTKRMVHSKRPGHSKHSRQSRCQVFPPSSLYSRARKLTMRQRKVDSYRLYCVAGKLTAALLPPRSKATYYYIYIMYIVLPFSSE